MAVRVVRAVPRGPAAFAVMAARAVPAVLVAGVVTPAQTRVQRDLPAGPVVLAVTRVLGVRRAAVRAPVVRPATPVPVAQGEPAAPAVRARMPRLELRAMREALVVSAVRAVPLEPAACGVTVVSAGMAAMVAGVVRPG